jgi:YD repeat-containing protein
LIRESYIPAVTPPISGTQGSGGGSSSAKIGKIATPPGLTLFGDTQDIMTVRLPHGSRAYFEIQQNDDEFTFKPFPGVKADLVRGGDVYTLTLPQEHTVYIFNLDQKLTYLEDKNGNRLTFGYITALVPSAWRCQVTDPARRSLTFDYDANRRLVRLTDPLSRTMTFSYTNSGLPGLGHRFPGENDLQHLHPRRGRPFDRLRKTRPTGLDHRRQRSC